MQTVKKQKNKKKKKNRARENNLYQFRSEHSKTRGMLNFRAMRIKYIGPLKTK